MLVCPRMTSSLLRCGVRHRTTYFNSYGPDRQTQHCRSAPRSSIRSTRPCDYATRCCSSCQKHRVVEDEVTKAFEEERQHGGVVLFPVRVDDAVFDTRKPGRPSCAPTATSATSAPGKITTPARKSSSGARRPQPETGGRPTTALGV